MCKYCWKMLLNKKQSEFVQQRCWTKSPQQTINRTVSTQRRMRVYWLVLEPSIGAVGLSTLRNRLENHPLKCVILPIFPLVLQTRSTTRENSIIDFSAVLYRPTLWDKFHSPNPSKFTPFCFGGFSSYEAFSTLLLGMTYSVSKSESSLISEVRNYDHHRWEIDRYKSGKPIHPVFPSTCSCFTNGKDAKKLMTCVIVVWKNVSPIDLLPVHILQVSFGHCRPLAASQVTRRKDMEVLHKFTQP